MSFPRYERYKDSGVEWLGQVPKHWEVSKTKLHFDIQLGKMLQPEPNGIYDEEVPYLKAGHVQWEKINVQNMPLMWASPKEREKFRIENGDLLVCEGGEVGRSALLVGLEQECIIQNALHRVRPLDHTCTKYLNYLMRHLADADWFSILCNKATIAHLTGDKLGALVFPMPQLDEQQTIARFLDHKTAQIDALIAKKEALLEKLAEKRTTLISHAVTKGLSTLLRHSHEGGNPEFTGEIELDTRLRGCDDVVPMKDSGVEWLGKVPEHWETKRLKFTVTLINEKIDATLSDLSYMGLEHIESWSGRRIDDDSANSEGIASHFIEKDVLFGKLRPYLAKVYLAKHEGLISTETLVLRSSAALDERFLRYYMVSREFIEVVNGSTFGSKMPRASWDFVGNLPMLLPEYHEQQTIARFLDRKVAQIDTQTEKVLSAIEKLKEYRSALITQAVTGKIDVRRHEVGLKAC